MGGGYTLRIFHISDLHERGPRAAKKKWRRKRVLGKAWWDHLREVRERGPIDLLAFTGDAADWGLAEEFEAATPFFEKVLRTLDVPPERFFLVPGNHDIQRTVHPRVWKRVRAKVAAAGDLALSSWLLGEEGRADLTRRELRQVLKRQQAYREWLPSLGRKALLPSPELHPHLGYRVCLDLPRLPFPIHVLGLDSAWLCGDDSDSGRLYLSQDQVGLLATDAEGEPLEGFRLALVHHPFEDLADGKEAWRRLAEGSDLMLRGHLHEPDPRTLRDPDRQLEEWAAGCLYEGGREDRYDNGCTLLELDLSAEGRIRGRAIQLYSFSATGGHWYRDPSKFKNTGSSPEPPAAALPPALSEPAEPPDAVPTLGAYRAWSEEQHRELHLIGLGAGKVKLALEDVYVSLALAPIAEAEPPAEGEAKAGERPPGFGRWAVHGERSFELGQLFRPGDGERPHVLILGDPGSGKTTSLYKLHHLCLSGARAGKAPKKLPGLAPETLPVFFRLRRFGEDDLDEKLEDLLGRELSKVAGDRLPADIGPRLWRRGRLLLLLDGLDEVSDPELRARVAARLAEVLEPAAERGIRAVVSCRKIGFEGLSLGPGFLPVEIQPLDTPQGKQLVRRWFREVPRSLPHLKQEAKKASKNLRAALEGETYASQKLKVLVGSPLLLTLLCVVALDGKEMPRRRAVFYDLCLRVLLSTWSDKTRGRKPPLEPEAFFAVLRPVAFEMHEARLEDLPEAELTLALGKQLLKLGESLSSFELLDWLRQEAGVLDRFGDRYGFTHRGLREYLVARHIDKTHARDAGKHCLKLLADHLGEEWWKEVTLLLAGLPEGTASGRLFEELLASEVLVEKRNLVKECVDEALELELEPFLATLDGGEPGYQAAVLRILHEWQDPRLEERARTLARSRNKDVAALARQRLERASRAAPLAHDVFLFPPAGDTAEAAALAARLRGWGLRLIEPGEGGWRPLLRQIVEQTAVLAVAVGPGGAVWEEDPGVLACLEQAALRDRTLRLVRLPGSGPANLPEGWPELPAEPEWLDYRAGLDRARESDFLPPPVSGPQEIHLPVLEIKPRLLPPTVIQHPPAGVAEPGEVHIEPTTSERFLWVRPGRFRMGGTVHGDEQPIHTVHLSGFWLAEVPVTNRRYALYLEAAGEEAREPKYWRDRRFSDPEQPVVGVSWLEARAYCRWLAEQSEKGLAYDLPTEAQWEYAARGTESREYPWGKQQPDPSRACFSTGQPAAVGSFPAGKGPFEHLDLAGNVWEWCLDAWDEAAYKKRPKGKVQDPPADLSRAEAPAIQRIRRGGAWYGPAVHLRAACRSWFPAWRRLGSIGFRVAVSPPSTSKS